MIKNRSKEIEVILGSPTRFSSLLLLFAVLMDKVTKDVSVLRVKELQCVDDLVLL